MSAALNLSVPVQAPRGETTVHYLVDGLAQTKDIFRNTLGPSLRRVEGGDADRVIELAGHHIGDDGLEVGPLDIGPTEGSAQAPKVIDDEVEGLIGPFGTIEGVQLRRIPNSTN
jgi:hypothetical protein